MQQRLLKVIALEQRQLAGIFLIQVIIFVFVLWWLLAYQFRVLDWRAGCVSNFLSHR